MGIHDRSFSLSTGDHKACFSESGRRFILLARGELHRIGRQRPYFAVGGETYYATSNGSRDLRHRDCASCGCLHDEIRKHVPVLANVIRWHGCDVTLGVSVAYVANAVHHAERWIGVYRTFPKDREYRPTWHDGADDCLRAFNDTIVYGAAPIDTTLPIDGALHMAKVAALGVLDRYRIDGREDRATLMRTPILPAVQKAACRAVADALVPWLESRRPALLAAFRADMATIKLDPDASLAEWEAYCKANPETRD